MRTRRILSLLAALLLVLGTAACGGDDGGGSSSGDGGDGDGGGGDVEAFCDQIEEFDEDEAFADADVDEAVEAFDELADLAPEEVQDDLDEIGDVYEELDGLDEDDPESATEAFDLLFDEDFIEATEDFARYLEDECGLEDVIDDSGLSDLTDGFSDDFTNDFSDDFSSDFSEDFSDDLSEEPDVNDASLLRAYFESVHVDDGFSEATEGIGSAGGNPGEIEFTLTMRPDADPELSLGLCDATLEFGEENGYDVLTVEVEQDDTVLATGELGQGCEAA